MDNLDLVGRVALAGFAGALLGFEREARGRTPGARTHALVAIGAALFTIAGAYGFSDVTQSSNADPARIAAQVAAGIGFIGAGAVLQSGAAIRGLTTAATLWVSAAVGVSAAAGIYVILLGALATSFVILIGLRFVVPHLLRRVGGGQRLVHVEYERGHGTLGPFIRHLQSLNAHVTNIELDDDDDGETGHRRATLEVQMPDVDRLDEVLDKLNDRDEVVEVRVDNERLRVRRARGPAARDD